MPDGKRRGGFARLAAVVKAERAKARATGGHVIFAHGGDTLSPSLMSGIDRGAHIITLTNLIPPDIFAPGNHEFDFGKAIFLQRMAEAKFPLYAANLRDADGQPLRGLQGPLDRRPSTACASGSPARPTTTSPRTSSPEDLQFLPTVATMQEQAEALRREGADFVVRGDACHAASRAYELLRTRAVDLLLTGHNHDLFINYDGRSAMVEVELRRALRHRDRRRHRGEASRTARARDDLVAAVPRHRHRDGDARPGGRGGGRASSRTS